MTGLEKMISQILEEAKVQADSQIAGANEEAAQIAQKAQAEADKLSEDISKQSEADVATYMERVKSSADLQRRTAILKAKQEVIADVLDKAYAALNTLGDAEYFDMIRKMLDKFVLAGEGDIYFSEADLKRLPAGFEKEIEEAAAKKGGKLTLSETGREIENGFILAYGGIEENCTFRALFNTQRDVLQDKVHQELFA
jgi:V/A-type H+-transporting ATPase subunit E